MLLLVLAAACSDAERSDGRGGRAESSSVATLRLAPGQVVEIRFGPRRGPVPPAPPDAGLLTTRRSAVPLR